MNIGKRIKEERKKLGLSVDYIAAALGKDRSTVYRYESNDIEKLPTTILEPLARILKTTPAYLMGWEENTDKTNPIEREESSFLIKYNNLNDIGQKKVDEYIDDLSENPNYLKEEKSAHENGPSIKTKFAARNGKSFERELTKEEIEKSKQLPKFPNNL